MPFSPTEREDTVTFDVLVSPRAGKGRIGPVVDDRLKIAVTAPPQDGAANAAVIEAIAHALRVPKRAVEIVHGASSRRKTVRVTGTSAAQVMALA